MATTPSWTAGVAIVAIVLVLGGATWYFLDGHQESVSEQSSGPPEATYTVTGNLSLYGFSPTPGGDYVDASTLTVRMGNLSKVPDASGALVQAINITLRTDEHTATYWTHPATGDLITVTAPDKRQRYDLGTTWNWSVSGAPSPFKPGEPWPERIPLASGSLSLANSISPLDPLSPQVDPWTPPPRPSPRRPERGTSTIRPPAKRRA